MTTQRVLFGGYDASGVFSLWASDGSAAGTKELVVAGTYSYGFNPTGFTQFGNNVLFQGTNAAGNGGLWITDGIAADTHELTVAGASVAFGGLEPTSFAVLGPLAMFSGYDTSETLSLWATNGTSGGTTEIKPAGAAATGLAPTDLTVFGTNVMFEGTARDGKLDLWRSNGTAAGTVPILVATAAAGGLDPTDLTVFGKKLLFAGHDANGKIGLWASNGTAAGTSEFVVAGAATSGLAPTDITPFGTRALFAGTDANGLVGLWTTTGIASTTTELTVAGASSFGLDPSNLTAFGATMLFSGFDASGNNGMWITNGTAAGTQQLIVAGASALGLNPTDFAVIGNEVLFSGLDSNDFVGLWRTDGTAAGTQELSVAGAGTFGLTPTGLTTVAIVPPGSLSIAPTPPPTLMNGQSATIGTVSGAGTDSLTVALTGDAAFATGSSVAVDAAGQIIYTPGVITAARIGADTITYLVTDTVTHDTITGNETVTLSNGPVPVVTASGGGTVANGRTLVVGSVAPGLAGDPLAVTFTSDAKFGGGSTLTLNSSNQLLYTPGLITTTIAGADKLGYTVIDGTTGATASGFLFLSLSAGPVPTIVVGAPSKAANGQIAVLGTATSGFGSDPLSVALTTDSAFATGSSIALGAGGTILYSPGIITAANVGVDTVSYLVTDTVTGGATKGSAKVTLSNGPSPIIIQATPLPQVANGGTAVLGTATGFGADTLSAILVSDPRFAVGGSTVGLGANGQVIYTPGPIVAGNLGSDLITYTVTDSVTGASATGHETVTLIAPPPAAHALPPHLADPSYARDLPAAPATPLSPTEILAAHGGAASVYTECPVFVWMTPLAH